MLVELWEWDTIIGDSYARQLDLCVAPHPDLRAVALTSFYLFSADFFQLARRTSPKSRDWR